MEQHSYQNSASGSPSRRNRGSGDRGFWLAAVLFLFFLPPVGILMIVVKVLGGGRKKPNVRGQHPYYTQQHGSVGPARSRTGPPRIRRLRPPSPFRSSPGCPSRPDASPWWAGS